MKTYYFRFLPLCLAATFPTYSFKSTVQQTSGDLRRNEDRLLSQFYSATHADMQKIPVGTCGVTPVPGCQCAWCTFLTSSASAGKNTFFIINSRS